MMRQPPGGLGRIGLASAPSGQVPRCLAECGPRSGKTSPTSPVDDIDVRVDLPEAMRLICDFSDTKGADSQISRRCQTRHERCGKPVPWRYEHRKDTGPRHSLKLRPTCHKPLQSRIDEFTRVKLSLLFGRASTVSMVDTVLQHRNTRRHVVKRGGFSEGGYGRQCKRYT